MSGPQIRSVQSDWCERRSFSCRRAFPGFAGIVDGCLALLRWAVASERRALIATAAALIAITAASSFVAAFFHPRYIFDIRQAQILPLVAIGLVASWSSLGGGAWHFRFLLALLVATLLACVHVSGARAVGIMLSEYQVEFFVTNGAATFAWSAFAAAWIRSIFGQELRGRLRSPAAARLARRQFSIQTLLWCMLAVAIGLWTWQTLRGMPAGFQVRPTRMMIEEDKIAAATVAALFCLLFGFRRWRVVFVALAAALFVLWLGHLVGGVMARRAPAFRPLLAAQTAVVSPAGISLALGMLAVLWLRWCGFRMVSVGEADKAAAGLEGGGS